jgi:hypothetical protein
VSMVWSSRAAGAVVLCMGMLTVTQTACAQQGTPQTSIAPGTRTLLDAHNCYPYDNWWNDRIDRALSTGTPLAIEQDLALYTDPKTGKSWPVVTHSATDLSGQEPTFEKYFFDRIQPLMEEALRHPENRSQWPLITLNLDFKAEDTPLLRAVFAILQTHQAWLTTARKTGTPGHPSPLHVGPLLVLTGSQDPQQKVFYDPVPHGGTLLLFGAVHSPADDPGGIDPMSPAAQLEPEPANDYRRWWNNPWDVVEAGGQNKAGAWTPQDDQRLRSLVARAHEQGLWIRFYTLDGAPENEFSANGWFQGYDFGSLAAARLRWRAAIVDGVDYLATDQYEQAGLMTEGARAEKVHQSENSH